MKQGWKHCSLGDALTFQRGFDITKKEQRDGPYKVISSSGPKSTHIAYKAKGPGVVIGRKGTLGLVFYAEEDYWPHDTSLWIKDFHGNDPKFAYYFLQTMGFEKMDVGAANPSLNRNHIHTIPVHYPDLPTQRKIAGILSAYDDLIENNLRRIKILEQMSQSLYREWFVHFRFPGHAAVKLVESPLGEIPEGWEVKKLKDACFLTMGQSPKSEFYNDRGEGTPFHQGVTNFGDYFPTDRLFSTEENRIAEDGDILFSVRAPVGRINVANKRIVIGRGVSSIRERGGYQDFLLFQLKHLFQEEDSMGNGAIFKAVTKSDMEDIKLLLPEKRWIERFEKVASPIFSNLKNLTQGIQTLRRTRDLLLPKLLSGGQM